MDREQIREIKKKLQQALSEKRYEHTLGVSYTCAALAMRYGADHEQAELAGLLHDCAKGMKISALREALSGDFVDQYTRDPDYLKETIEKAPQILHAIYGPVLAREKYGITDPEVLSAIRWHTTGKQEMTPLEKIVFVADLIEPNRTQIPNLERMRSMAFSDLDQALFAIGRDTIVYLEKQRAFVDQYSKMLVMQYLERDHKTSPWQSHPMDGQKGKKYGNEGAGKRNPADYGG